MRKEEKFLTDPRYEKLLFLAEKTRDVLAFCAIIALGFFFALVLSTCQQ